MLCYPIKALGSVTINGAPITRGETIQAFGELRVDIGTYRMDEISVWNNNQRWTPVSIEGNVLVFNLQSNGEFLIFVNSRRLIFDFRNDMRQDFSISRILFWRNKDEGLPIISERTYVQAAITESYYNKRALTVESLGTSLEDLAVRIVGGDAVDIVREGTSIHFNWSNYASSVPVSIYVGDVLVGYFTRNLT